MDEVLEDLLSGGDLYKLGSPDLERLGLGDVREYRGETGDNVIVISDRAPELSELEKIGGWVQTGHNIRYWYILVKGEVSESAKVADA